MNLALFLSLMLIGCSFKKGGLENQTLNGHYELYSAPAAPKQTPQGYRKVVIAATNDIHGQYAPLTLSFKDRHHGKQEIEVGGVDIISSYFKILRQQHGELLLLDSGDIFGEGSEDFSLTQKFYQDLSYDAVTVGIRDFNLKLPSRFKTNVDFFRDFSAKSKAPLLLSNLYNLKSGRIVDWKGTAPYLVKEINGVKVGIIGLIPDDLVDQTPVDNRVGLYVENMLQSTLRYARLVRSLGAEIVVILTHQGMSCGDELAEQLKLPLNKVNFEPEKSDVCDITSKLGDYLNRLPPNLVDVVIGGRHHQKMANFINSTLVLSAFPDGQGFSWAEFFVKEDTGKLDRNQTIVHQPVLFCREFFKETNDCYSEDSSVDHKVRSEAKFLGLPVKPNLEIKQNFLPHLNSKSSPILTPKELQVLVDYHHADLAYLHSSSGDAKLILLSMNGKEIAQMLEEDFNQGGASYWHPSPFFEQEQTLFLNIRGAALSDGQNYRILGAIDDFLRHPQLRRIISRVGNQSLNHLSWNEPRFLSDDVTSGMAASEAVR